MVWIVETKVFRHVIDRDERFVEVPVRVRFEYGVTDGQYDPSTIEYDTLFNEGELLRRFPGLDATTLREEVETMVHRALDEELRFAGLLPHGASLFDAEAEETSEQDEPDVPPEIFMPPVRTR